jgi:hypothetical protein
VGGEVALGIAGLERVRLDPVADADLGELRPVLGRVVDRRPLAALAEVLRLDSGVEGVRQRRGDQRDRECGGGRPASPARHLPQSAVNLQQLLTSHWPDAHVRGLGSIT